MIALLLSLFGAHWRTSLLGMLIVGVVLWKIAKTHQVTPEDVALVTAGVGLLAASDGKSSTPNPPAA